jgi:2-amino-4-hydroxy-6-hydroxymethyldihydropteridine diphosphokinase
MILIGLGANLPGRHGSPETALKGALARLEQRGISIERLSNWYWSAPVPPSGQPDFVNLVASIGWAHDAPAALSQLHAVEEEFDRRRAEPNAARTLDLDLLDFHGQINSGWPTLPHPRLHQRLFVLLPLRDVAPAWRHPATGETIAQMLAAAPAGQKVWQSVADQ